MRRYLGKIDLDVAHVVANFDNRVNREVELLDKPIRIAHVLVPLFIPNRVIALAKHKPLFLPAANDVSTDRTKVRATHRRPLLRGSRPGHPARPLCA